MHVVIVACSPSLPSSRTLEREEREGQRGTVNARMAWSNLLHIGQNNLAGAQVLKVNGFDSWSAGIRRFYS